LVVSQRFGPRFGSYLDARRDRGAALTACRAGARPASHHGRAEFFPVTGLAVWAVDDIIDQDPRLP
jgi:hypothetical protein